MNESDKELILAKTVRRKIRTLKPYEKNFIKKGEFRYLVPQLETIESGNPTVCYTLSHRHGSTVLHNGINLENRIYSHETVLSTINEVDTEQEHSDMTTTVLEEPGVASNSVFDSNENRAHAEFLDDAEVYFQQLKIDQGISIFASAGRVSVLREYCAKRKNLHPAKFVLIERRSLCFCNAEYRWAYWCSCSVDRAREIAAFEHHINLSYEEFCNNYPDCIHLQVARMIFQQYDTSNDIEALEQITETGDDHQYSVGRDIVYQIPNTHIVCCCEAGGVNVRFGLVSVEKNKLSCLTCSFSTCCHTKIMKRIIGEGPNSPYHEMIYVMFHEDASGSLDKRTAYKQKVISFKKIPFFRSDGLAEGLRKLSQQHTILLPDLERCSHCNETLMEGDPIAENWIANEHAAVITNTSVYYSTVYYRPCPSCGSLSIFEGQSKCLLNLGTYLVGYDVLRSYLHSFLHGRRPLYTFYQTFCDVQMDYGNATIQYDFSYQRLRNAWIAFLNLLDINFNEGFSCPDCGGDNQPPETIICDGTTLSFQRRMWDWKEDENDREVLNLSASSFSDRVFIQDPSIRKLLQRYASNGELIRGKKFKKLKEEEKKKLFTGVQMVSTNLYSLLLEIEGDFSLHDIYRNLLLSLASPSPVCSSIRPKKEVQLILKAINEGAKIKENPKLMRSLHQEIPIIFEICEKSALCENVKNLLPELWTIAVQSFVDATEDSSNKEDVIHFDELSYFPSLEKYRNRGRFEKDKHLRQKDKEQYDICQKKYLGHPSLLPGIFTLFCPHGICYGFQVMESNESPNVPFTIMRSRFKKAPKHVIYDNACKLQDYCLNRDPCFFQHTEFYVDRLHWDNHTSCSISYNLSLYPQLSDINSQVNEQANAGLKRIKAQLSYMTANNFMNHCSLYLWYKNMKIKEQHDNIFDTV